MTPGSPPRAMGDHSSLETRGQEGDPSPEGTGNGGALGRSLETQGKRAAPKARSTQNVQDSTRAETDSGGVVAGPGGAAGRDRPSRGGSFRGDGGAQGLDGGERCTTGCAHVKAPELHAVCG